MKLCLFVPSKVILWFYGIKTGSTNFIAAQKFTNVIDSLITNIMNTVPVT